MTFKKKKIKKSNTFLNIVWFIIIISLSYLGFYVVSSIDLWPSNYQEWKWVKSKETQEFKKEINILIIWRWWELSWNDAPNLTDTIILAKINKEKKNVALLSVQRDLYVNYPEKDWTWKINSVYSHYYYKSWKDEKEAMSKLSEKIKDITWEEIDYYVNVDFAWFKKIIDTIWWVEIDVKESIVDRTYPNWNWWYQTVSFKKWIQTMNWDQALKYSRTRHSTSDFDRSLRQQQIIQAIKNKITSWEWVDSVEKITKLYNIFTENLKTDISINDTIAIIRDLWVLKENYKFISSNFNDTCWSISSDCEKWWILYVPKRDLFWWAWVSLINWSTHSSLSKYDLSRKYANIVLNFPEIENEDAKVNIFNWTKVSWAGVFVNNMKRYWFKFTDKNFVSNAPEVFEESIIYYNWIDSDSDTIQALKYFFKWKIERVSEPKFSNQKAKIELVIWNDYIKDKSIFNF